MAYLKKPPRKKQEKKEAREKNFLIALGEAFLLKKSKLYRLADGRWGLPLSFYKLSRKLGWSVGCCQCMVKSLIERGIIEHEYARNNPKYRDCKLFILTDEGRELVKKIMIESGFDLPVFNHAPKKYTYNNIIKNNINLHERKLVFKKHDDSIGATLARMWIEYAGNVPINPKLVRILRASYDLLAVKLNVSNEKMKKAYFKAFLEHQSHFLKKFSEWAALSFKSICKFIEIFKKKGLKWISGSGRDIILDACSINQRADKKESEDMYKKTFTKQGSAQGWKKPSESRSNMNFLRDKNRMVAEWQKEIDKLNGVKRAPILKNMQINRKPKVKINDENLEEVKKKMIESLQKAMCC